MKKLIRLLIILMTLLLISGCATVKPYLSYTVYPVGYLINRISGGKIEAVSIQNNNIVQTSNIVDNFTELLENSTYFFLLVILCPNSRTPTPIPSSSSFSSDLRLFP